MTAEMTANYIMIIWLVEMTADSVVIIWLVEMTAGLIPSRGLIMFLRKLR